MDPELGKLIVGIVSPVAAAGAVLGAAWLNSHFRRDRDDEEERQPVAEPAAVESPLTIGRELHEYIQRAVSDAVAAATSPLNAKIETYASRDRIMVRYIQRLYWWDEGGRAGDMPRLTYEEQHTLDLDLDRFPGDTQPGPLRDPERYG